MAKRQVNKNLVGILTVTGVILAVAVVSIATFNAARKDPELLARKAQAALEGGNPRRAMELYGRAFRENKEVKYLLEASRIAYRMGDVSQAIGQLIAANSQDPGDVPVLEELLTRFWELHRAGVDQRINLRDYSAKLLELQPDNLLGLVSRAEALERLREQDPHNADLAAEALEKAIAIDENDPSVALVRVQREINEARIAAARPRPGGDPIAEGRKRVLEILRNALAEHPAEPQLVMRLAAVQWEAGDLPAARQTVEDALAQNPDDCDLHLYLARVLNAMAAQLRRDGAEAERCLALLTSAREHVERALALEPGLFEAYGVRAAVLQYMWEAEGRWEREPQVCQNEIIQLYSDALRDTVGLKSIRAVLGRVALVRLIAQAFDAAIAFYAQQTTSEGRAAMLSAARRFYEDAKTRFSESVVVPLMEGQLAMAEGDARGAIQAFLAAEVRASELSPAFARMARENLTFLYREVNELGNALKYAQRAIDSYTEERLDPPLRMLIQKGQLLTLLDRAQEALDTVDQALRKYPDDRELVKIRATALAMLGRTEDAQAALGATADDPDTILTRARFLAISGDLDQAEELLRKLIDANPENIAAITLLMQVLSRADRNEQGVELINQLLAGKPSEQLARVLTAYQIVLVSKDPAERDAKLLEIIETIPEREQRVAELFNFYVTRGSAEKAAPYLDEMETLRPNDDQVQRLQFDLALQLKNFPKAEKYLALLTQRDADHAGGAVLRGMLKFAQGDIEAALREYRTAELKLPTDAQLKLRIAQALLQRSPPPFEEVVEVLQQALDADPRSFLANKFLYVCLEQLGRREEGLRYLQQAAKLNPNDPFIRERSRLLEEEADPAKGIAWREPLREQEPYNVDNLLRLSELYVRAGQDDKAEHCLNDAAAAAPQDVRVAQAAAIFFATRGRREDGERILEAHRQAVRGYALIRAYELLGKYYESLNLPEQALAAFLEGRRRTDEDVFANEEERRAAKVTALAELAEFYGRRGQLSERIDTLRAVLSLLKPEDQSVRQNAELKILKTLMQLRQFGEAEQAIAKYRSEYPTDPRGAMAAAELLTAYNVTQQRLEQARAIMSQILQDAPDHRWCLLTRGRVNLALGRFEDARADLVRLKQLTPTGYNLEHRFMLARLYELQNQRELAERELRELVALNDPPNQSVAMRLLEFLKRTQQISKAQEFVNQLAARYPNEAFWPYQLGVLLKERGEHSAAVTPLERAAELTRGSNPAVLAELIEALVKSNRPRDAVAAFEKIEPQILTPLIRVHAAGAYLDTKQRDKAIAQYGEAVLDAATRRPADVTAVLAAVQSRLEPQEAERVLREALSRATGDGALRAQCVLARFLIGTNDSAKHEEVRQLITTVRSTAAPGSYAYMDALLTHALWADRTGDAAEAAKTYEELLRADPTNVAALNNLAYLKLDRLNQAAEALPYAERAAELAPNNGSVLDTLGWAYLRNNELVRAESTLLEALRLEPENLAVLSHVAEMYLKTGRPVDARTTYNRMLDLARRQQNSEYIQAAEKALRELP